MLYSGPLLVIYFIDSSVYISILISQFIPPPSSDSFIKSSPSSSPSAEVLVSDEMYRLVLVKNSWPPAASRVNMSDEASCSLWASPHPQMPCVGGASAQRPSGEGSALGFGELAQGWHPQDIAVAKSGSEVLLLLFPLLTLS